MNEIYKTYLKIKRIESVKGLHTQCITLYVAKNRALTDVNDQLRIEKRESSNIKDKTNRDKVISAIDKIAHNLRFIKKNEVGYCIFSNFEQVTIIQPPVPNILNKYVCGKTFMTEHLKTLLKPSSYEYGLIVLDGGECTIAKLQGQKLIILKQIDSEIKNKVVKGGQSARRYSNARDESLKHYYAEVCELVGKYFDKQVTKIYFGGNIPASEQYLQYTKKYLPIQLSSKFSKCYPVPYADRMGIRCLLELIRSDIAGTQYEAGQQALKKLRYRLDNYGWLTENYSSAKSILICESVLLSEAIPQELVETIPISVFSEGQPIYELLTNLYHGVLYLK